MKYERKAFIESIVSAVRDAGIVHALWENGSEVFGRTDEYSDIDLMALVSPGQIDAATDLIKSGVSKVAVISNEVRKGDGDWRQYFWQFEGVSPLNFIDITLLEHASGRWRIGDCGEGEPIVHLDRNGCLDIREETPEETRKRVHRDLQEIADTFALEVLIVQKYVLREQAIHAFRAYQREIIATLVRLLRIKHCPERSSWSGYIEWDLPADVIEQLKPFMMVSGLDAIRSNLPVVEAWVKALLGELRST